MLSSALLGTEFDIKNYTVKNKEVKEKLSAYPISHENVLVFSIQNLKNREDKNLQLLRDRIDSGLDLDFLKRWYSPSLELVPEKYRITVEKKIDEFLDVMTSKEERILENWDMEDFLLKKTTKDAHGRLKASF